MSERQLDRDDVFHFLLPYNSRVYNPFELLAEVRSSFEAWVDDGKEYKYKITFKLKNVVDDDRKVYGISNEMMEMVGSWKSPMSGKNWWVNPTNPNARTYSNIFVECPKCGAKFGGVRQENAHREECPPGVSPALRETLHEQRIEWLERAAYYVLDMETASKRLGLSPQTVRDMVWEEEGFSYEDTKHKGRKALSTTWHIAREWGTDNATMAAACGFSESTVHSYISRYSQVEGEIPTDPTSVRTTR
ncbi:hypothetical protein DNAM5_43 [Haloarcula californiae tailed virus 1]|uniref:Uncharacterized protein n=1 Tax=Haloarcula californiae tailed virus 1 TaxID=1273746 RepID=R4THX9_9CAUD|nr:hypothetical protein M202_gp043 [Haloarcula californiae tailed virus 1]AGM11906.1 hypothetical protein DNAM5_43 [Haloarcula californiae tailed virus 1]